MTEWLRVVTTLTAVVVTSSCVAAESGLESHSVADSVGVEVVTSRAPAWSERDAWRVSAEPLVRIGEVEGPPEATFGRVSAGGWLPDGRIFVGDDQAHVVRVYSAEGEYQTSLGREGHGPGELLWFSTVSSYRGDSLFVYDRAQRAVSVFSPDFGFVRRFTNPTGEGFYRVVGALGDGRFVLGSAGRNGLQGGPGLVPDTSLIIVTDPVGMANDTIGAFEVTVQNVRPNGRNYYLFLKPQGKLVVAGDRVIWTEGRTFRFTESTPDGTVRRIARTTHEPVPVDEPIIDEFKVQYLEWLEVALVEGTMAEARQSLEDGAYHPHLPMMSDDVLVDGAGNTWLGHRHPPGGTTERWTVFDRRGVWLGMVDSPPRFEVLAIGADRMLGVARGDLDVPYVEVRLLLHGAGGG